MSESANTVSTKTDLNNDGDFADAQDTATQTVIAGDQIRSTTTNGEGDLLKTTISQFDNSGNALNVSAEVNGNTVSITNKPDGSYTADTVIDGKAVTLSIQQDETETQFRITGITNIDGTALESSLFQSLINASARTDYTDYSGLVSYLLDPNGRAKLGQLVPAADPTSPNFGIQTFETRGENYWYTDPNILTHLSDANSLLAAIKSGNPLPIATSVFGTLSHQLSDNPVVGDIASGLSTLSSLKNLTDALQRGDIFQVAINSGSLASTALQLHQAVLRDALEKAALGTAAYDTIHAELSQTAFIVDNLGKGLAVLNLISAIDKNDLNSAVIAAVTLANPAIGAVLSIANTVLGGAFGGNQTYRSEGRFVGSTGGQINLALGIHDGGANVQWNDWMGQILKQTQDTATARQDFTGIPMGVIAERLPRLTIQPGQAMLWYPAVNAGREYARTFDLEGNYLAAGFVEGIAALNSSGTTGAAGWRPA